MQIISDPIQMQRVSRELRRSKRIGFVPTMGALHAGHLSLMKMARSQSDAVVASIFVNPLQFGPTEDFSKYPRTFERDCQLLEAERVDFVFAPSKEAMYPAGAVTAVEVAGLSERLDGRSRPGHFKGVTTVVAKLFGIVQPDRAFFGQKDAAQVAIIRRMVRDLNFDVEIVVCPIVRESDGLAMSSRNVYLDPQQRREALVLSRALNRIQFLCDKGEKNAASLITAGKEVVAEEPGAKLDYLEIVNPDSLEPVADVSKGALVAIAAWVGSTRLIDNVVL
ncbi:MAG TPA: pantoate--beta-alanine ligase [Terriglobales bacterium]|nr:pantoate--beta-alanine ligase [Terriglobales bacterium]